MVFYIMCVIYSQNDELFGDWRWTHSNLETCDIPVIETWNTYHKISNIKHTKYPNLNASRLILQMSLPNPMKPGVKSRMKM